MNDDYFTYVLSELIEKEWSTRNYGGKLNLISFCQLPGIVRGQGIFKIVHKPSGKEIVSDQLSTLVEWLQSPELPLDKWDDIYLALNT